MNTKIAQNYCSKFKKQQELMDANLKSASKNSILFKQMLIFNKVLSSQLIRNHAKEDCFFCSSAVDAGELSLFYTFEQKLDL